MPERLLRVYFTDMRSLAYFHKAASPDFWDERWLSSGVANLQRYLLRSATGGLVVEAVRRHLPVGSTVLEGGCGRGQLVRALKVNGYRVIGIDFAQRTVEAVHQVIPELELLTGDVRCLPLPNASIDGYVSIGVIEHFWEGYHAIIAEAHRVLRPGGLLFISFPYMSPLRRWKVHLGAYSTGTKGQYERLRSTFYQFVLPLEQVQSDLECLGFRIVERLMYDGIKGFKDEVSWLKPWLQPIYEGRRARRLRPYLDEWLKPFASHCIFLVLRKSQESW